MSKTMATQMTWEIIFHEREQYMEVITHGQFDNSGHQAMLSDILGADFWQPGLKAIFDHRNLDFSETFYNTIFSAKQNHLANDDKIGNGKAALLMKNNVGYGIGRMFQQITNDDVQANLKVFLTELDARQWLLND